MGEKDIRLKICVYYHDCWLPNFGRRWCVSRTKIDLAGPKYCQSTNMWVVVSCSTIRYLVCITDLPICNTHQLQQPSASAVYGFWIMNLLWRLPVKLSFISRMCTHDIRISGHTPIQYVFYQKVAVDVIILPHPPWFFISAKVMRLSR